MGYYLTPPRNKLLIPARILVNLKRVMLSARCHIPKGTYSGSIDKAFWKRQDYRDREQVSGWLGMRKKDRLQKGMGAFGAAV